MKLRSKKLFAAFFLLLFGIETFYPGMAYALTSGPAQPEMQKFEPAGTNDMVDLFSGDFKYNIPLMDVGGYPVNLSYQSGTGIEDEASWVGTGWTLNPGAVTRNMRGLPDDFNGDQVTKKHEQKEFRKVGGTFTLKPSLLAIELGKPSIKLSVYKDNYYGMGASFGASLKHNMSLSSSTPLTAALSLDVNSDVRNGVDIQPNLRIGQFAGESYERGLLPSLGFHYNTREGLKSTTLGLSYSTTLRGVPANITGSVINYFGASYSPSISEDSKKYNFSFSLDGGITFFGLYAGIGGTGFFSKETYPQKIFNVKGYGYMNYDKGRLQEGKVMLIGKETFNHQGKYLSTWHLVKDSSMFFKVHIYESKLPSIDQFVSLSEEEYKCIGDAFQQYPDLVKKYSLNIHELEGYIGWYNTGY